MHRFTDLVMLDSIDEHLPPCFEANQFNAAARAEKETDLIPETQLEEDTDLGGRRKRLY